MIASRSASGATVGEERAAAVLQSGCRGVAGRKEFGRRKSAANVIQQRLRRKTDGQKQAKAAIVLQACHRRAAADREAAQRQRAVQVIQERSRLYQSKAVQQRSRTAPPGKMAAARVAAAAQPTATQSEWDELTTQLAAALAELELYQLGWRALVSLPGLPELPAFGAARDVLPPRLQEELREKATELARPAETATAAASAAAAGSQGKSPTRKAKPKAAAPAAAKPKTSAPTASKAPAPARPASAGAKATPTKSPPKARPASPAKAPTAKAAAATPARSASPARPAKAPASATPARGASPARGGRPAAPPKAGAPKAGAPKAAAPQAAAPSASKGAGGKGGKGGKLSGALAPRANESLAEVLVGRQTLANLVRDCERDEAALREHLSQAHATLRSMCQLGASELGLAKVPNGVVSAHAEAANGQCSDGR